MSTKIDDAFATLRILIADQTRDLALAIAELRSVARQRDVLRAERDAARQLMRAAEQDVAELWADNSTLRTVNLRILAELASVAQQRDKLKIERDEAGVRADFADLAAENIGDSLDKLRAAHQIAVAGWNAATIERDDARQSLRAAEQDAAETESVNSDLRTVNARLVADLAAAMERAETAEAILRAKA